MSDESENASLTSYWLCALQYFFFAQTHTPNAEHHGIYSCCNTTLAPIFMSQYQVNQHNRYQEYPKKARNYLTTLRRDNESQKYFPLNVSATPLSFRLYPIQYYLLQREI